MIRHVVVVLILVLAVVGCGSSEQVEKPIEHAVETATKPVEELAEGAPDWLQEAQGQIGQLSGELKTEAEGYQSEITSKYRELEELKAKVAKMKPADLLTDKGKEMAARSETLVEELDSLREKLKAVLDKATTE